MDIAWNDSAPDDSQKSVPEDCFSSCEPDNEIAPQTGEPISLSKAYMNLLPGAQTAIAKITETLNQFARIQISIPQSTIASIANVQQRLAESLVPTLNIAQTVSESLKPILESISKMVEAIDWNRLSRPFDGFDWESLQDGAKKWGECGWVINDLSLSEIRNAPESVADADAQYLRYLTKERVTTLFETIQANIPRKVDFRECVSLYENRHYKPCAMMLCALIEGQLIKQIPNSTRRRNGKAALTKASELDRDAFDALWIQNTFCAYMYFYGSGNNFDRKAEGELNRNFLMHGMMYKRVKKSTCIKLFLILESVVSSMPDARR